MPKTTQSNERIKQVAAAANYASVDLDARTIDTPVKFATVVADFDGSNVATDVIELFKLPPGAVLLPQLSSIIVTDDMTSGALTIHVGDAVDDDRYCISANCAAPGVIPFIAANATTFPAALLTPHKVKDTGAPATDTSLVLIKLATFTATIEDGQLVFNLAYKCL
jgi:hypothetical protein